MCLARSEVLDVADTRPQTASRSTRGGFFVVQHCENARRSRTFAECNMVQHSEGCTFFDEKAGTKGLPSTATSATYKTIYTWETGRGGNFATETLDRGIPSGSMLHRLHSREVRLRGGYLCNIRACCGGLHGLQWLQASEPARVSGKGEAWHRSRSADVSGRIPSC